MKFWIVSFLLFSAAFGFFTHIMLAQISDNAVEAAVHSEFCCESYEGCPNGVIPECQVPEDGGLDYRISRALRDGVAGATGLVILGFLSVRFRSQRLWNYILPGSIMLPLSLCLMYAQLYVWIWNPPLFD